MTSGGIAWTLKKMIKHRLLVLLILLVGCQALPTGEVTHSWLFVDDGQYNVADNQFNITVAYNKQQRYYRVGAHDSWGTKHLDSRLIDVSIQLNDDMDEIKISADFQQNTTSGVLKSSSEKVIDNIKHQSSKNICVNPTGLPLNQLPANQETYQYHMTVCPDSLVITDKTSDDQCIIDLAAQNEDLIQLVSNGEKSLATHFAYSLQDSDGSVVVHANNWRYVREKKITFYQVYCDGKVIAKSIDIEGMGEQHFIVHVSNYGDPTAILHYNNRQNNPIVTLNGDVQYDGPMIQDLGWSGLFLPDQKVYYDFDTKLKEEKSKDQFELITTRYEYDKAEVTTRNVSIEIK